MNLGKLIFIQIMMFLAGITFLNFVQKDESQAFYRFFSEHSVERAPAESGPRCFVDRMQKNFLRAELRELEKSYAGKGGSYRLGGNNFDKLTQPTIDALKSKVFLQSYFADSWVGSNATQKGCGDLECLVNALYSRPTDEGLFYYWFYLKTGYVMASAKGYPWYVRKIPGLVQNHSATKVAHEKYLWNLDELKAWWLVIGMLPPSMLKMPSIGSIHRLPHGYIPDEWKKTGECGWGLGLWNKGVILLSDECLLLEEGALSTKSFFYQATTHELAHRLSVWNFAKTAKGPAYALHDDPSFLSVSGWKKEELVVKGGSVQTLWKSDPANDDFISDYSKTAPAEDFAESLGFFRTKPELMKEKAPKKYAFIKRRIFNDKGYVNVELKQQYAKDAKNAIIANIDQWMKPCLSADAVAPALTDSQKKLFDKLKISVPVEDKLKDCIRSQVVVELSRQFDLIRYNEFEGCSVLDASESEISGKVVEELNLNLDQYLGSYPKLADLLVGVQDFRTALNENFDSSKAFISCWKNSDPQSCYEGRLQQAFESLRARFGNLLSTANDAVMQIEQRRFNETFRFDVVQTRVSDFYDSLFRPSFASIEEAARDVLKGCMDKTPYILSGEPLLEPYHAGANYVAPFFIQCLNLEIPEMFADLRTTVLGSQGIEKFSNDGKDWIDQKILFPRFKAIFDKAVKEGAELEEKEFKTLTAGAVEATFKIMTEDQSWRQANYLPVECKKGSFEVLQYKMRASTYRFLNSESRLSKMGDEVCEKIKKWAATHPRVSGGGMSVVTNTPAPTSEPVSEVPAIASAELNLMWPKLLPLFVQESETRFDHCRGKAYFLQKMKRFCLFSEWAVDDVDHFRKNAWDWTSDRAIRRWVALPEVKTWMRTKAYTAEQVTNAAKLRVDQESQTFVDAVLERFFGGQPSTDS